MDNLSFLTEVDGVGFYPTIKMDLAERVKKMQQHKLSEVVLDQAWYTSPICYLKNQSFSKEEDLLAEISSQMYQEQTAVVTQKMDDEVFNHYLDAT